jgi:RNA polymerase sigma factor (sigma-70 family)
MRKSAPEPSLITSNRKGAGLCPPALTTVPMRTAILNPLLEARHDFLRFLERRVRDRAAAEDILQGAYLRALEAGGQLRAEQSARAWFFRVLRNAVIDHYRRRAVEASALDRWALEPEREAAPEQEREPAGCPCIAVALADMSPVYADLLRTVDLHGTRLIAYAKKEGITSGNAAVRAHRARAALRRKLKRCCGPCAEARCVECTCGALTAD